MIYFYSILLGVVQALTEFLPISSTAHMGFAASLLGMGESEFLKMFQVSIQFGAILAIVVLYWKKFFDFSNFNFYIKLIFAVIPALVLKYKYDTPIIATEHGVFIRERLIAINTSEYSFFLKKLLNYVVV